MRALLLVIVTLPFAAHAGEVSPRLLDPHPRLERVGPVVRAIATLEGRPTPRLLGALARAGARPIELAVGGLAQVGRLISLDVPRDRLLAVAAVPGVVRLDPAVPLLKRPTLDRTTGLSGGRQTWLQAPPGSPPLDGRGVVIADHELAWDPFHPDFFFPDGGLWDWIDRDGDGTFGTADALVIDGRTVRVALLEPTVFNPYNGVVDANRSGLQPELDWIYVDENGNGARDSGRGFAGRPALGEPLFVGDDVDGDGSIRTGEKLVRLGTPKVSAIYDAGRVFDRTNLTDYQGLDASHGVGTTGILAGGWPELRRFTGMAPAASLVLINTEDPVEGIAVADRLGAHIHYWEFVSLVEAHDGSSALEVAISESAALGVVQVTATGNIGGSGHNMAISPLGVERPSRARFDTVPPSGAPPAVVLGILTWRGAVEDLRATLGPRGAAGQSLPTFGTVTLDGLQRLTVEVQSEVTSKGTAILLWSISAADGSAIQPQTLELVLTADRVLPEVRGLLVDDVSGWGVGAHWLDFVTDRGNAMAPSTADRSIAVGAYGGNNDLSAFGFGGIGELRNYSGTGPRLDGMQVVDLVAPDDPFAPALGGGYEAFSGTSGALPHVVGAAALAVSSGLTDFATVEAALIRGARTDAFTARVPNPRAGFGKVSAVSSLRGDHRDPGPPPRLEVSSRRDRGRIRVEVRAITNGTPIERIEIDREYDRIYDEAAASGATSASFLLDGSGGDRAVVRVVDRAGQTARALIVLDDVECEAGQCRAGAGLCQPCAADAGVPDTGSAVRPDAAASDGSSLDAGRVGDAGPSALDGGGAPRRPPTLETIPRRDWTCGCRASGEAEPATALLLLALVWVVRSGRWSTRRAR